MFPEAGVVGAVVCLDRFYRLVPLPFHHWCLDPWHRNGDQYSRVFAWYISLHRVLRDFETFYISLSE